MDLLTAKLSLSFSNEDLNSSDGTATSLFESSSNLSSSGNELDYTESSADDDDEPSHTSHGDSRSSDDPLSQPLYKGADVTIYDCLLYAYNATFTSPLPYQTSDQRSAEVGWWLNFYQTFLLFKLSFTSERQRWSVWQWLWYDRTRVSDSICGTTAEKEAWR